MTEAIGGDSHEPQPNTADVLTTRASDCLGAFAGKLAAAEQALTQFDAMHHGREFDEAAQLELRQLQLRVERQVALIQGATIMVEHLGLPAPDGSSAWGAHNAVASQLAADVHSITIT